MDYKITGYEPEKLFHFFEEISAIPRGSGNEKGISDYLVKFAKDRGLEVIQDDAYNVVIKKAGSRGAEDHAPVMLQGHMDMVCEKRAGVEHDLKRWTGSDHPGWQTDGKWNDAWRGQRSCRSPDVDGAG